MQSLRKTKDVVVYVQSLLNEGLFLPYYNVARLLNVYGYTISDIKFIEPTSKQDRLSVVSIQEKDNGVALVVSEKSWANYLPLVYRNEVLENFLYGFQLSMFKQIEIIDRVDELFTPEKSPNEFVSWLASWFNLSFSKDIKLENQRKIIYKLSKLYGIKGTKKYLIEMVELLTDTIIDIKERTLLDEEDGFEDINKNISFVVSIIKESNYKNSEERDRFHLIIKSIILSEKPIFTYAQFDDSFVFDKSTPLPIKEVIKESTKNIYTTKEDIIEEKKEEIIKEDKSTNEDDDFYDDFY